MMVGVFLIFVLGLVILYYGAEYLVAGSSKVALALGVRPLVVGLTIVSLATSMPEMMVSLVAAIQDSADIAAGNIIGSNIANMGLILGCAVLLQPLVVPKSLLKREVPFMLGASFLCYALAWDGFLGRWDGLILVSLLVAFIVFCLRQGSEVEPALAEVPEYKEAPQRVRPRDIIAIVAGFVGLGLGAEMMVRSGIIMAQALGLSELVIGMTVVALGTSLPEFAASVVSAWRGETEISIGNVVGSNIFNLAFVLGLCPVLKPLAIRASALRFEFPVMLAISLMLVVFCFHRYYLHRLKGAVLLAAYLLFMIGQLVWG